jgi:hypothetical protein
MVDKQSGGGYSENGCISLILFADKIDVTIKSGTYDIFRAS